MKSHNLGSNLAGKFSTFLCIQQVTKDGVFLGSNRLKHATTGMLEMRFDEDNPDLTYLEFTKNRRGAIGHRLYFDLRAGGNLEWQTPDPQSEEHPEVLGGDLAMRALARLYPE
jgi:predicted ATP-dependent serine protease